VQLVRRGGAVLVQDLGSKNRAELGEGWLPTDKPAVWRRPAVLRVGRTVLALHEPVAEALAELEGAADEALPEAASIPPPPAPASVEVMAPVVEAPVAKLPTSVRRRPEPGWSPADIAVAATALFVMALSAAGLYWLLRPQ